MASAAVSPSTTTSFLLWPRVFHTVTLSSFVPQSASMRSPISFADVSAISAYSFFVCSYTSWIEEPGRISWNWLVRIISHIRFSSSVGYAFPVLSAKTDRSSNSIIAYSLLRLPRLLRAIEVYVPRWNSKYSSPIQVGRRLLSFTFSCSSSKYVLANAWRTFGTPLMPFSIRLDVSSILLVGPPPPSP